MQSVQSIPSMNSLASRIGCSNFALAAQVIVVDSKYLRGRSELSKGMDHAVSTWAADAGVIPLIKTDRI